MKIHKMYLFFIKFIVFLFTVIWNNVIIIMMVIHEFIHDRKKYLSTFNILVFEMFH